MATVERDLDRSPTSSTSLLPVVGPHRKLNGQCGWSGGDDDVAETSFIVKGGNGDVPGASQRTTACSFDHACFPATSPVSDCIEMSQRPGTAAAVNQLGQFYVDTKGADVDSGGNNVQHGTCSEAGPRAPTSFFATDSRSAYARVAEHCSLPPEVEQLRRACVTSASSSSDEERTTDKFM